MNRHPLALFATISTVALAPSLAFGQIGFSRRQQAGMLAYQAQIKAQEQVRQQATLNLIQRQFAQQQGEITRQQIQGDAFLSFLEANDPDNPNLQRGFRPSRRNQSFGTPHYSSPMFMRYLPYYDRQFVQTRNRQIINLTPSIVGRR